MLNTEYRKNIDGLRGVSILAVIGFHAFPKIVPGGYVGVTIFFVISGFLITLILLNGIKNHTFSLKNFWARRIRRIFPALIVVLMCSYVLGYILLLPNEFKDLGRYIIFSCLFLVNFLELFQAGYFDKASELKPLLHLWSLGIEEQFYVVWPVYIWFIAKYKLNFLKWILILLVTSFLINMIMSKNNVSNYYFSISRFWEILSGASLAYLVNNKKIKGE